MNANELYSVIKLKLIARICVQTELVTPFIGNAIVQLTIAKKDGGMSILP